jgi:hypothetical protein
MDNFILSLRFFCGLILFSAVCWLFGHLLRLDKKYVEMQKELKKRNDKK